MVPFKTRLLFFMSLLEALESINTLNLFNQLLFLEIALSTKTDNTDNLSPQIKIHVANEFYKLYVFNYNLFEEKVNNILLFRKKMFLSLNTYKKELTIKATNKLDM